MFDLFKQLLDPSDSDVDFEELVKNGATVIDVRTPGEYRGGHIKGSINIPLQQLASRLDEIDDNKPVVLCCATGSRSGSAKRILKSNGFTEVYNGGGWARLKEKVYA